MLTVTMLSLLLLLLLLLMVVSNPSHVWKLSKFDAALICTRQGNNTVKHFVQPLALRPLPHHNSGSKDGPCETCSQA